MDDPLPSGSPALEKVDCFSRDGTFGPGEKAANMDGGLFCPLGGGCDMSLNVKAPRTLEKCRDPVTCRTAEPERKGCSWARSLVGAWQALESQTASDCGTWSETVNLSEHQMPHL